MNADIINPFVVAAFDFIEQHQKATADKGKLSLLHSPVNGNDVNVVIGLTGSIRGQVVYCMSTATAQEIASNMLIGLPIDELDEIAKSAIGEMGNIITGQATCVLASNGLSCSISPPSLVIGKEIQISFKELSIIAIPICSNFGEITMMLAVEEADPS